MYKLGFYFFKTLKIPLTIKSIYITKLLTLLTQFCFTNCIFPIIFKNKHKSTNKITKTGIIYTMILLVKFYSPSQNGKLWCSEYDGVITAPYRIMTWWGYQIPIQATFTFEFIAISSTKSSYFCSSSYPAILKPLFLNFQYKISQINCSGLLRFFLFSP